MSAGIFLYFQYAYLKILRACHGDKHGKEQYAQTV